jgi:Rhodopirellula transposase DDE domain
VFAVESIRRWWQARGSRDYPQASRLLITADAGGSNGYRHRVWKSELAALAAETGLAIMVCHFPPGTSKTLVWVSSGRGRVDLAHLLEHCEHLPGQVTLQAADDLSLGLALVRRRVM